MEVKNSNTENSLIEKILSHKTIILIVFGILIRLFMLGFYYITHTLYPSKSWGDVGINFSGNYNYPPLTMFLMGIFQALSFGMVEVFAFWAFLLEILVAFFFYYVLKSYNINNLKYVYGLFLINPFFFLNNVFSLENCGYHISDSFFFIFLFLSLYFYPKEEGRSRYLFYIFLAFSIVSKIYTLPSIGFLFLKYLIEKDWDEMKKFLIGTIPIIFIFLVSPVFFIENYLNLFFAWNQMGEEVLPLYVRLIPVGVIGLSYIFLRLKKAKTLEITFFSILFMVTFMFFSQPFIRYFQPLLIYGILTPYVFFTFTLNLGFIKRKIVFDNHLFVFYISFILVGLAYLIIIFLL